MSEKNIKHYLGTLGLNERYTEDELKHAFRKLSRECHPDLHGNTKESQNKFNQISEAYAELKNELNRKFARFGIRPTTSADEVQIAFMKMVDVLKKRMSRGDTKAEEEMKVLSEHYQQLQTELLAEAKVEW